ncbi:MAG: glycerophosphodiester phosphodiesterase [Actinomycetota bacterium]
MRALGSRARLVVAHRGASATEPENTLAAFDAAFAVGADAVELDVRLTSDGVPLVLHDPDVSAATDGSGLVNEMTLEQVKRLDASGGRGPRQEVPTLAEALELIGDRGGVDLEIKNLPGEPAFDSPREAVLEATLEALEASAFRGPVLVSSFNWLTLERCKQLAPEIPTGFLTIAAIDAHAALVYALRAGHDFVLPQTPALLDAGEDLVQEAHRDGVRVGTWVADDPGILETLFSWGVDAIACNDPAAAIAIRERVASAQ